MKKYSHSFFAVFFIFHQLAAHSELSTHDFFDKKSEDVFVSQRYLGAQRWFDYIVKKYPQAKLESVDFCISDNYQAGTNVIYFPEFRLQRMNEVFGSVDFASFTDVMLAEFAEDEYLLLHEAKHVMSDDYKNGNRLLHTMGYTLAALCLTVGANKCCEESLLDGHKQSLEKIYNYAFVGIGAVALCSCPIICWYARFQERRADAFANQTADQKALRAGILWYARLNTLMNFENITIPDCVDPVFKFIQDPYHQTPKFRQQQAMKAYFARFET